MRTSSLVADSVFQCRYAGLHAPLLASPSAVKSALLGAEWSELGAELALAGFEWEDESPEGSRWEEESVPASDGEVWEELPLPEQELWEELPLEGSGWEELPLAEVECAEPPLAEQHQWEELPLAKEEGAEMALAVRHQWEELSLAKVDGTELPEQHQREPQSWEEDPDFLRLLTTFKTKAPDLPLAIEAAAEPEEDFFVDLMAAATGEAVSQHNLLLTWEQYDESEDAARLRELKLAVGAASASRYEVTGFYGDGAFGTVLR